MLWEQLKCTRQNASFVTFLFKEVTNMNVKISEKTFSLDANLVEQR